MTDLAKQIVEAAILDDSIALKDAIFEMMKAKSLELIESQRNEVEAEMLGATVVAEAEDEKDEDEDEDKTERTPKSQDSNKKEF